MGVQGALRRPRGPARLGRARPRRAPRAARWVVFRDVALRRALIRFHDALATEPAGLAIDEAALDAVAALRPHLRPGPAAEARGRAEHAAVRRARLHLGERWNERVALGPEAIGEDYVDAGGCRYLPLLVQPVLVFEASAAKLQTIRDRAARRELPIAIYTTAMFSTGNDPDNRAAVRAVQTAELDLAWIALRAPHRDADAALRGLQRHP